MNNDLISRQDAIDEIGNDIMGGLNYRRILLGLPSAQRKGKWLKLYTGNYKCSACGCWWCFTDDFDSNEESEIRFYMHLLEDFKYCPSCGAQMEKGEQDG